VAAIARRLATEGAVAAEPIAFVHVFERLRSCDEWAWASPLVEETGIAVERMVTDELSNLVPDPSLGGPADTPLASPGELTAHALERARERGCAVVTTGYGGDTLFDAARWRHVDLVRRGRWAAAWPWVEGARSRGTSWPRSLAAVYLLPLLGRRGRRGLDRLRGTGRYWRSPPWLRPEHRERAEARRGADLHPRRFRSRARQDQYEHLVGLAQQGPAIDAWSAEAARRGIEARFPLLDRRLAELVLAAPLSLGARPGPGGSKWLLRRATEGVLPEAIRRRPDKGSWGGLTRDSLCRRLASDFRERFDGSRLAALGLVDDAAIRAGLDGFCTGRGAPAFHGTLLATAWQAESWLRHAEAAIR
jgi:asparagine synthetase B (glutamine-hydrolysing)